MDNFNKFFENELLRLNNGGVGINDYVEVTKVDIDCVTNEYKDRLKKMKDSDLNIKVLRVEKSEDCYLAEICEEISMGLYKNKTTIPVDCLKVLSRGRPNGIPSKWFKKDEFNKTPYEHKDVIL